MHRSFTIVGQSAYKIPWPLDDRELVVFGAGDVIEGNQVLLYLRSAREEDLGNSEYKQPLPPSFAASPLLFRYRQYSLNSSARHA